jgi:chemotaxis protein MotB
MAQEMRVAIDAVAQEARAEDNVAVEESRDGVRINLMDTATRPMFRGSSAEPNAFAVALLQKVARQLQPMKSRIAVEGHTDAAGGASAMNWTLSAARAETARRLLQAGGVSGDRIAEVVAMAGTRPVYPAEPDRPENRRITIVVLAEASALPTDASFRF